MLLIIYITKKAKKYLIIFVEAKTKNIEFFCSYTFLHFLTGYEITAHEDHLQILRILVHGIPYRVVLFVKVLPEIWHGYSFCVIV